jgi:hypothetical protein
LLVNAYQVVVVNRVGWESPTTGKQPAHVNVWFTGNPEEEVNGSISGIESYAERDTKKKTSLPRRVEQTWALPGQWTGVFGDD